MVQYGLGKNKEAAQDKNFNRQENLLARLLSIYLKKTLRKS